MTENQTRRLFLASGSAATGHGSAPSAELGKSGSSINPELRALAAELDKTKAYYRNLEKLVSSAVDRIAADRAAGAAFQEVLRLEHEIAKSVATNFEEAKLKARYVELYFVDDAITESIIRDLLAS
ncbi:hypothetical protein [Methylocapsa palsarum]|uniref:hypothetical protein n=1 Tax=Methylocapsa palsarum TaxID=1612308 RepID=UPI001587DF3D|nr:hypothetical protein [Methylocapsa palsarum]